MMHGGVGLRKQRGVLRLMPGRPGRIRGDQGPPGGDPPKVRQDGVGGRQRPSCRSQLVRRYPWVTGGYIVLMCPPAHAPQLNPIQVVVADDKGPAGRRVPCRRGRDGKLHHVWTAGYGGVQPVRISGPPTARPRQDGPAPSCPGGVDRARCRAVPHAKTTCCRDDAAPRRQARRTPRPYAPAACRGFGCHGLPDPA